MDTDMLNANQNAVNKEQIVIMLVYINAINVQTDI